jgi:hypothetical protein
VSTLSDDLAAFLLARIAEEEQDCATSDEPESWCDRHESAHYDSRRVLAECEAKRRIVEQYEAMQAGVQAAEGTILVGAAKVRLGAYEMTLRFLAPVYCDHPNYRAEWAP